MGKEKFEKSAYVNTAEFAKEIIDAINSPYDLIEPGYYIDVETIQGIIEKNESPGDIGTAIKLYLDDQPEIFRIVVENYQEAMDYLKRVDPGLNFSIEIVKDIGYSLESINSNVLASELQSEDARDEFEEKWSYVETSIVEIVSKYEGEESDKEEE